MPTFPRAAGRLFPVAVAALLLSLSPLTARADAGAPPTDPEAAPPADLSDLAERGDFDALLTRVRSDGATAGLADRLGLTADLERYHRNQAQRDRQRREALESAMDRARAALTADNLEDAVIAVIEAHSLADDPTLLLQDRLVQDVVARTQIAAQQAEVDRDWLEASTLYGRLNLLHERDRRFHADLERTARHLRVLSLYRPQRLRELMHLRDQRLGKPAEEIAVEPEDWQQRLVGLHPDIVRRSIERAAVSHIEHRGYEHLVRGAIDAVLVLLDTDGLTPTFPQLGDDEVVDELRRQLVLMRSELEKRTEPLNRNQAQSWLDRVFAANQRTVNLPENVVVYETTEGALSTLDEFTSMYWPEDVDSLRRSTHGSFVGVGIQIYRRDNQLTVVSPLPATPAQQAGVQAGDVIATVNGRDTTSWSLDRAVREITGPEGTPVTLSIRRAGLKEPLDLTIVRARIDIESVKGWAHTPDGGWDYWLDRDHGVGYFRVTQFIPQTVDKMNEAIDALRKQGNLRGVIIDLRFNPGGLLTSAIDTVNRFVPEGALLHTVNGQGQRQHTWPAERRGTLTDLPLVILINRGSASASEIVAGVLQDHHRAFVVGDRSYGKGSVQNVFWFPSERDPRWGLKVTTEYYQLPGGRIIHRTDDSTTWGIEPDLTVAATDDTVAWGLELRQEIDVIRKDIGRVSVRKSNPAVKLAGLEPADPRSDEAKQFVEVEGVTADTILDLGLDPQLEAAMLLLKARQLEGDVQIATGAADRATVDR